MHQPLCSHCSQAALLPAGLHTCLANAKVIIPITTISPPTPFCTSFTEGHPKLLSHQDLLALNASTNSQKLKSKETKEKP
jgi:hypothetical protein